MTLVSPKGGVGGEVKAVSL